MWFSFLTSFQQPQVPLWSSLFPFIRPSFLPSFFSSLPPFTPQSHFPLNVSEADWGKVLVDDRCIVSQRLLQTHQRGFILTHSFVFSCPSLFSANEEGAGGCHGNPEEAQRHGPQHRGRQGRKHQLEMCVCVCLSLCVKSSPKIQQIRDLLELFKKLFSEKTCLLRQSSYIFYNFSKAELEGIGIFFFDRKSKNNFNVFILAVETERVECVCVCVRRRMTECCFK